HATPNPGQAKKATPMPTVSFPVLPTLPPGYSPTPTPIPTPTPTPGATTTPTPTPGPPPTPTPAPTASFTYSPANPVTGQAVSFNGSGSSCLVTPCAYIWSDDGASTILGGGVTLIFTFQYVGTKYVRLTITDGLGRQATVEHNAVTGVTRWSGPAATCSPTPARPPRSSSVRVPARAAGSSTPRRSLSTASTACSITGSRAARMRACPSPAARWPIRFCRSRTSAST